MQLRRAAVARLQPPTCRLLVLVLAVRQAVPRKVLHLKPPGAAGGVVRHKPRALLRSDLLQLAGEPGDGGREGWGRAVGGGERGQPADARDGGRERREGGRERSGHGDPGRQAACMPPTRCIRRLPHLHSCPPGDGLWAGGEHGDLPAPPTSPAHTSTACCHAPVDGFRVGGGPPALLVQLEDAQHRDLCWLVQPPAHLGLLGLVKVDLRMQMGGGLEGRAAT